MLLVLIIPVLLVLAQVLEVLGIVHALEAMFFIAVVVVDVQHRHSDCALIGAVAHLLLKHVGETVVLVFLKSQDLAHLHLFWLVVIIMLFGGLPLLARLLRPDVVVGVLLERNDH